jgi:hypothetical protein
MMWTPDRRTPHDHSIVPRHGWSACSLGHTRGLRARAEVAAVKRHDREQIVAAARAVAAGGTDATGPATRLISTAEALASVVARLELADEPRLLSVTATPLADVARVKDVLRAIPASTPRFLDTGDRRELHVTVEVRDGEDNWLGDVQFVWGV